MFYIIWILGVLLGIFAAAVITISGEKTGTYDEE